MEDEVKPIKKANPNQVEEAKSHPSGPNLTEMLVGEENKTTKKVNREDDKPDGGPIPVI